jgi:ribonuclease PH
MTASGRLVEVQASAEKGTFTGADLGRLLGLAREGCRRLVQFQERARRARRRTR